MPEKNIPNIIQNILDQHKGFVNLKTLPSLISAELRLELGLKNGLTGPVIRKKLEPHLEDKFIFHKKGLILYLMTPCEPDELVISLINSTKSASPKLIARSLPFTKKEFLEIVFNLIEEGRVKLTLNENLDAKLIVVPEQERKVTASVPVVEEKGAKTGDYSPRKFREAFDALDKGRIFVRICDLRRKLDWPRDVFDEMLRTLRDDETIQLHEGDASTMTPEENADCFTDENNCRMGTVTWNVR